MTLEITEMSKHLIVLGKRFMRKSAVLKFCICNDLVTIKHQVELKFFFLFYNSTLRR